MHATNQAIKAHENVLFLRMTITPSSPSINRESLVLHYSIEALLGAVCAGENVDFDSRHSIITIKNLNRLNARPPWISLVILWMWSAELRLDLGGRNDTGLLSMSFSRLSAKIEIEGRQLVEPRWRLGAKPQAKFGETFHRYARSATNR
jgi:hypothetical protein